MLYLTCTTITSLDLAHYEVSRAKDWVSVDCGSIANKLPLTITKRRKLPITYSFKHGLLEDNILGLSTLSKMEQEWS